ncbi:putative Zinc finger, RanBP2-type, endonuclease/exonuclease/phosphatase [Dioscorea sansibarensis]
MASSWACSRCTFINPSSDELLCTMCGSPSSFVQLSSSSPSSSSLGRWSCLSCTFSNPAHNASCEMCETRAPSFSMVDLVPDELSHPSIGSVFLPLQACGTKRKKDPQSDWKRPGKEVKEDATVPILMDNPNGNSKQGLLKVLSYNVWFREDLEVFNRMKALGDLIQQNSPDIICFQEVTPNIYEILKSSNWWDAYNCSVRLQEANSKAYFCMQMSKLPVKSFSCKPFSNSIMGRELCLADINTGTGKELLIATSHLESPCPAPPKWDQMFSTERVAQAKQAISILESSPNVIFGGDMNWDDKLDRAFPLPEGWIDAWKELKSDDNGFTYDTKANPMLQGNRTLQKRLDRFICRLSDFKLQSIELIGTEPIPGLSYCKEKKVKNEFTKLVLPVLPSDHFGLLLTLSIL